MTNRAHLGTPVYAASFIRKRKLVLESQLFDDAPFLRLILAHELFHFAWPRLGNCARTGFTQLVTAELAAKARGELGESAAVSKANLNARQHSASITRYFRDYCCEAFCDTGAYLYAGVDRCEHFTLAARWRRRRIGWFEVAIDWNEGAFEI